MSKLCHVILLPLVEQSAASPKPATNTVSTRFHHNYRACQVPSRWPRRSRTNWAAGVAGAVAPSQPGAPHRSPASPSSTAPTLTRLWSPRESCHSEIWTPSCGPLLPANASRPRGSTSWRMTSRSRASILSSQGASAHLLHVPTPAALYRQLGSSGLYPPRDGAGTLGPSHCFLCSSTLPNPLCPLYHHPGWTTPHQRHSTPPWTCTGLRCSWGWDPPPPPHEGEPRSQP